MYNFTNGDEECFSKKKKKKGEGGRVVFDKWANFSL